MYKYYLLLLFIIQNTYVSPAQQKDFKPADYVNPFIGTAGGGNTFPGAVVPWGMVSISPHNTFNKPSGYLKGEKYFYGFGHVHLSGVGCNELGSVVVTATRGDVKIKPEDYKTTYSNESAKPGYYNVTLDQLKLRAETAAAKHSGIIKFTALEAGEVIFIIDAGQSLAIQGGGKVFIKSDSRFEGVSISGGFCGEANRENVFFNTEISKPSSSAGTWTGSKLSASAEGGAVDSSSGVWFKLYLKKSESLYIKTGISYVNSRNALLNLQSDIPAWDFNKIKNDAFDLWNNNLLRVKVSGSSKNDLVKFYTALYHMLLHPNVISDINGEYPLMGRKGTGKYTGRERYSVFSLWDTYRTLHPFLTLVYPEIQSDIIKTMIDMYEEGGYLPKWELAGIETYMMVGDPAAIVIADSYIKGIRDFDTVKAFNAILKPALLKEGEEAPPIRAGYHELLKFGYIPFEQNHSKEWWVWGPVSTSLEYNLSDYAISRYASAEGNDSLSVEFLKRSLYYRNVFDSASRFMRPKLTNGEWMEPFDPYKDTGSEEWAGSGGPGFVEGNAWNYTWFVPHDIQGLITLFGGENQFADKLKECFDKKQFTINNEPDISYPYLFNYIKGKEYLTSKYVSKIIDEDFGTGPDGLPGNDDCGAISAWLVFSMLGFYPDCPAADHYQLVTPQFRKSEIVLNRIFYAGDKIIVENEIKTGKPEFNNRVINNFKINHKVFTNGGILKFK